MIPEPVASDSVYSTPRNLANINGVLYFAAANSGTGIELWRVDPNSGTAAIVGDIALGSADSSPQNLTDVNGTLYFTANDGTTGAELWRFDPVANQTAIVKDINPNGDALPSELINISGTLFFTATTDGASRGLWKIDPLDRQAKLVESASLIPANPTALTNVNGTLYFAATDSINGTELWKVDPVTGQTSIVLNLRSNTASSSPQNLFNLNGILYFVATGTTNPNTGTELWRFDPATGQATLVSDIRPGGTGSFPETLTNVNGTLYFTANDGTTGRELWRINPATGLPELVKDINPSGSALTETAELVNVNGTLYFIANDGTTGRELWRINPATGLPELVKDINPNINGNAPRFLTNVDGTLYFSANDGVNGTELWSVDPITGEASIVKDIRPNGSASVSHLINLDGTLYFVASAAVGDERLWRFVPPPSLAIDLNGTTPGRNFTASFTENGTATLTSPNLKITNSDDSIDGAIVTITNFVAEQDELLFTAQNGITGRFADSRLTLTGTSSIEHYETALKSIVYRNNSDRPTTTARQIEFALRDGSRTSSIATTTLNITTVNDAPVLIIPSIPTVAANQSTLISGITITDVDANDSIPLTVTIAVNTGTISLGTVNGLHFVTGDGIDDQRFAIQGNLDNLNAALATLSYRGGSSSTGTLSITVNDNGNGDNGITAFSIGSSIVLTIANVIEGTNADESFTLTQRTDQINASGGNDTVDALFDQVLQNDLINGGNGTDRLILRRGNAPLTINAANNNQISGISGFIIRNFEEFDFGQYSGLISFIGTSDRDWFIGGFASDRVTADFAHIQQGDQFIGREGRDRFVLSNGSTALTVNLTNVDTQITNVPGLTIRSFEEFDFQAYSGTITFSGTVSSDSVWGGTGHDRLDGGAGNDFLSGGAGINTLIGGFGDDTYLIQSATDSIIELLGQGIDRVLASISFTLSANVEHLTLTETAQNGTGNTLNNQLSGNNENNTLIGLAGDDILRGLGGADILVGGQGNDTIDVGRDSAIDIVVYAAGDGRDTILNFQRGIGGDQLRIESEIDIDVVNNGATTTLLLRNERFGFGRGTPLMILSGTTGFNQSNIDQNLAIGNQAKFFFA